MSRDTHVYCTIRRYFSVRNLVDRVIFTAQHYASAISAMTQCSSGRLSFTGRYSIETAERIKVVFGTEAIPGHSGLFYKGIRVYQK